MLAGLQVSVAGFSLCQASVPLSHVHVVCFKDDLVPVPSYFRSLERLPRICASYVPHLVFLSVNIYICVYVAVLLVYAVTLWLPTWLSE